MSLKCGIVGLPNVGKSTLFNTLTSANVSADNFPFCTIEPNHGVVEVPDSRIDVLTKLANPQRTLHAVVNFVDIAGLIAGASKGEGLGNQFLSAIRETDAIAHVVRCFDNESIIHTYDHVDPLRDIDIIHQELMLSDLAHIENILAKRKKNRSQESADQQELLETCKAQLDAGKMLSELEFTPEDKQIIEQFGMLTIKPIIFVLNCPEDAMDESNPYVQKVIEAHNLQKDDYITLSCSFESEIAAMAPQEQVEFLQMAGLEEPGLNRLIQIAYRTLGLQTYFTVGEKEVRAWTIPIPCSAPQAAGVIHSDFEKGFIRAEVISYDDFVTHQTALQARNAGKARMEGKEYIVNDGDVIHFHFN